MMLNEKVLNAIYAVSRFDGNNIILSLIPTPEISRFLLEILTTEEANLRILNRLFEYLSIVYLWDIKNQSFYDKQNQFHFKVIIDNEEMDDETFLSIFEL